MNDLELDRLVAAASPFTDAELAAWLADAPWDAFADEIDVAVFPDGAADEEAPPAMRSHRRTLVPTAAACVVATVASVLGLARFTDRDREPAARVWAAELVALAESTPLLLLDDPAWRVDRVDDRSDDTGGEMSFTDGADEFELFWLTETPDVVTDDGRVAEGEFDTPSGEAEVFSVPNTAVPTAPGDTAGAQLPPTAVTTPAGPAIKPQRFVAVWELEGWTIEVRSTVESLDAFTGLLGKLRVVDTDTWLRALPASVIAAADASSAVAAALEGVPLPDGFDPASIDVGGEARDEYQLLAAVATSVACAWMDQWFEAAESGDASAADEAADALATSRRWPALLDIADDGAMADVVWELADAVNGGPGIATGGGPMPPTRELLAGYGCSFD